MSKKWGDKQFLPKCPFWNDKTLSLNRELLVLQSGCQWQGQTQLQRSSSPTIFSLPLTRFLKLVPFLSFSRYGLPYGLSWLGLFSLYRLQIVFTIVIHSRQIVNEAAKYRYRSGNLWDCGSLTFRLDWNRKSFLFIGNFVLEWWKMRWKSS